MSYKSHFSRMAALGATTLALAVGGSLVYNQVSDPRHDDAFDHTVFNQCVEDDWVFVYGLKDGSYESTILENSRQCGGEPETGSFDGHRIEKLDEDGKAVAE